MNKNRYRNSQKLKDFWISAFLFTFALIWLLPIAWTLWNSFRPYSEVLMNGIFSWPKTMSFENYVVAFQKMQVVRYLINTLIVLVPSVLFTLLFSSMMAFVITKYRSKYSTPLLLLFTAGSILPAQVILYPIFKMYISLGSFLGNKAILYDNYLGIILVHVALQSGFATFVLHSYLKTIPYEISEQAAVDGASVWRHYISIILPMIKMPLLTLAVLISTWIYNDFFWGFALMKSDSLRPISTALGRLGALQLIIPNQGVLAAGSMIAALPLVILYIVARRHFSTGLIVGTVTK